MKDLIFDIFTPQTYRLLKDLVYTPRFNTTLIDFRGRVEHFKISYKHFINSGQVRKLLRDEELKDEYVTAQKMSAKAFIKITSFQKGLNRLLKMNIVGEEGIYKQIQTGNDKIVQEFFGDLRSTSYYLTNNFDSFLNHFVRSLERESVVIRKQILYLFLALTLLVGLFTVILTIGFARRISGRLQKVENAFERVSKGDFSVRLGIKTNDEFGLLSKHFNLFIKELKNKVDSILDLFEDVGASISIQSQFPDVFGIIVKSAVRDSNADGAVIYIEDNNLKMFSLSENNISFFGKEIEEQNKVKLNEKLESGEFEKLVKQKYSLSGQYRDHNILLMDAGKEGFNSLVVIPLVIANGLIGNFLFIKSGKENSFTDLDFIHFTSFVKYVSLSIDNFLKYKELLKKGEAEYKALQSQINPHFLYNVLNNLIGLNRLKKNKVLEQSIFSLKDMLRYTLEQDMWTTIKKEFDFLDRYCKLQKLRFQERLEYEIDYDSELAEFKIPKLILQPIVENAVIHGIEPLDRTGKLSVSAEKFKSGRDQGVKIHISDDGTGLSINGRDSTGIGLSNVRERLNLAYQNVSFTIESNRETGTSVLIKIISKGSIL